MAFSSNYTVFVKADTTELDAELNRLQRRLERIRRPRRPLGLVIRRALGVFGSCISTAACASAHTAAGMAVAACALAANAFCASYWWSQ